MKRFAPLLLLLLLLIVHCFQQADGDGLLRGILRHVDRKVRHGLRKMLIDHDSVYANTGTRRLTSSGSSDSSDSSSDSSDSSSDSDIDSSDNDSDDSDSNGSSDRSSGSGSGSGSHNDSKSGSSRRSKTKSSSPSRGGRAEENSSDSSSIDDTADSCTGSDSSHLSSSGTDEDSMDRGDSGKGGRVETTPRPTKKPTSKPTPEPTPVPLRCGDGRVDADERGEECDPQANPTGCRSNEYCDAQCGCQTLCGNGEIDTNAGETCDFARSPDGCPAGSTCGNDCLCKVDPTPALTSSPTKAPTLDPTPSPTSAKAEASTPPTTNTSTTPTTPRALSTTDKTTSTTSTQAARTMEMEGSEEVVTTSTDQSAEAMCILQTSTLSADSTLQGEWTKIGRAFENDVSANTLAFCNLASLQCEVDIADYDDDYMEACMTAGGQLISKSITFGCSGSFSGIPIPEGFTFGILNWPLCAGSVCNPSQLPREIDKPIDAAFNDMIDQVDEGLGDTITCEILSEGRAESPTPPPPTTNTSTTPTAASADDEITWSSSSTSEQDASNALTKYGLTWCRCALFALFETI